MSGKSFQDKNNVKPIQQGDQKYSESIITRGANIPKFIPLQTTDNQLVNPQASPKQPSSSDTQADSNQSSTQNQPSGKE